MTGDEADVVFIAAASRDSGDHLAADDDRAGGVLVTQLRIGDRRVPRQLARPRVQGDDVRVVGGAKDAVSEDRDVSLDPSAGIAAPGRPLREAGDLGLAAAGTRAGAGVSFSSGRYSQIKSPVAASALE
jgi:hypothetical protein